MTTTTHEPAHDEHVAPPQAWDAIAEAYGRYVTPGEADIATQALCFAGLGKGDRFLDVAAGTGGLSFPAAKLGARVVATDWSATMIACLESEARKQKLDQVESRVMDCHALEFADGTFDVTGSQFGVMLVPDQGRALREMVRVTKPGGRVLVIAYGSPAEFEALHLFIGALQAVVPDFEGLPDDPPPLEFQVADPEVLRRRMIEAGLKDVTVDTSRKEKLEIRSGQDLWNWCLGSNPIPGMLVSGLTETQKAEVIGKLDSEIRARRNGGDHAVITAPLNVGLGTK